MLPTRSTSQVEEPTPIEPTMKKGAPRSRSIRGLIRVERPFLGFRLLNQLFGCRAKWARP